MSFFKKLFGRSEQTIEPSPSIEHKGYLITATPIPEGGQFRLCADITREIEGQLNTHRMIRADIFPSKDDAIEASYRKGKQMIDEQGDRIFR